MTAKSYSRGHEIESNDGKKWFWADTKESISKERPCKRCNCYPTKEGHDACIGNLKGVKSACCGHGITESYIVYE